MVPKFLMVPELEMKTLSSMVKVTPEFIVQVSPGFIVSLAVIVVLTENVLVLSSQASPIPSPSVSVWSGLVVSRQLSTESRMPSLSSSGSQALPSPSASVSSWSGLAISTQLSTLSGTQNQLLFDQMEFQVDFRLLKLEQ